MKYKILYSTLLKQIKKKRDELLTECYDLNLPVSRNEGKEVLTFYLETANDDVVTPSESRGIETLLQKEAIYIGRHEPKIKIIISKFIQLFSEEMNS